MDLIKAKGGKVTREPGPVKGGSTVIAFIEDPDGYKFELLERGPTPEPLCQVMLRVGDLDRAITFYEKVKVALARLRKHPFFSGGENKLSYCYYFIYFCSTSHKVLITRLFSWFRLLAWSFYVKEITLSTRYLIFC